MNGKERQNLQTKEELRQTLMACLRTTPFEEITIKQVLLTAHISRRTFYRHFKNKEELLSYYFSQLFTTFLEQKSEGNIQSFEHSITRTLLFWRDHQAEVRILIRNHRIHQLLDFFNERREQFLMVLGHTSAFDGLSTEADIHAAQSFLIGGYFNLIKDWVATECRLPISQLVHSIIVLCRNLAEL